MEMHKTFNLVSGGERLIKNITIDPSSLSVGVGSVDEHSTRIIRLDCSIGVWNWEFSTLDKNNLTKELSKTVFSTFRK